MECDDSARWFLLTMNLLASGLAGYWWVAVRRVRRTLRELAALRATVDANLDRAALLLHQLDAVSRHDDDVAAPPLH